MNALKPMRWLALAVAILSLAVSIANAQLFGPGFKASDPFKNSPLDPRVYGPNSPKRPNTNTSWLSTGGTQNSWQQQQQQIAQQQAWQRQQQIAQQQAWQRQQQIAQQQAWQRQQQIAQQQAWQRQQQAALLGGMINELGRSIDEGIRRAQYENAMRQAIADQNQPQYGQTQPNDYIFPAQAGQPMVQRYQIPSEYAGTQPGQLINYGGISYLTNNDGTMSPYQGPDATPAQTQQAGQPAVQRYQIPSEYAGTQPGQLINYGGASYLTNNDGTMSPYQGPGATPSQTQQVEQPAVQRYQIPPEYAGTQPGYVINYGGASYLTNDDGTMSPYQGPEAR